MSRLEQEKKLEKKDTSEATKQRWHHAAAMISLDYDHITALSKLISKWFCLNPNTHTNALA